MVQQHQQRNGAYYYMYIYETTVHTYMYIADIYVTHDTYIADSDTLT